MANYGANDAGSTLQRSLAGASPAATEPTSRYRVGTRLYDDTGLKSWQVTMNVAGTAKIWTQLTGPGAPGNAWPKYVVSEQPTPLAQYTRVEDAVTAAAVTDGHNAANPAVIMIMPGAYNPPGQIITVPPGISFFGFSNAPGGGSLLETATDVFVNAGLVVSGSASTCLVSGITFTTTNGVPPIALIGASAIKLAVKDCAFASSSGPTALLVNSDTGNSAASFSRCSFTNTDHTSNVLTCAMAGFSLRGVTLTDCLLSPTTDSDACIVLSSESPAQVNCVRCTLFGLHTIGSDSTLSLYDGTCGSQTAPMFTLVNENSNVRIQGTCSLATPSPLTAGPGYITSNDFDVSDPEINTPGAQKAAATVSYSIARVTQEYVAWVPSAEFGAASPYTFPEGTQFLQVAPGGANVVVNLRALNTYFNGERVTIKSMSTLGDVAITPNAADQIDGLGVGAAYNLIAGTAGYGSVTLEAVNSPGRTVKWSVVAGTGAASAGWGKYVVSGNPDILAPYLTPQAAYAALKAAGHAGSVLIHPGTYSGTMTLDTPGISLVALVNGGAANTTDESSVVLSGAVTIALSSAGRVGLSGIKFAGGIVANNSTGFAANVVFDRCAIEVAGAATGLVWTNVGGFIESYGSRFASATGNALDASTVALGMVAYGSFFVTATTGSPVSLWLSDATAAGQRFFGCQCEGPIFLEGAGSEANPREFYDCRFLVTGGPFIDTDSFAAPIQAKIVGGTVNCATTPSVGSPPHSGSFTILGTMFIGAAGPTSATTMTLASSISSFGRPWSTQNTSGTLAGLVRGVLTTAATPVSTVLTLPEIQSFPDGETIEIVRSVASANAVAITAGGGNSVNGAGSLTLTDATINNAAVLRAERVTQTWRVVSVLGTFTLP